MGTFGGWAVNLGGVAVTWSCENGQAGWDETGCFDLQVLDALDAPPEGLDIPGLRVEDVTYYQRDGVKHFSDWYLPRDVVLVGTVGPADDTCENCNTARQQMQDLAQEWKRTCCDTELVIYTPCSGNVYDDLPTPGEPTFRTNLATAPRGNKWITEVYDIGPSDDFGFGTYSLSPTGGPAEEGTYARKTSTIANIAGSAILVTMVSPVTSPIAALSGAPVTAGLDYTLSWWVRSSVGPFDAIMTYRFYDDDGVAIGGAFTDLTASPATLGAAAWHRVSATVTAPANAVTMAISLRTTGATNGMTTDITGILFEQASAIDDYFTGATPNSDEDPALGAEKHTYAWTGNEDESTSTEEIQIYVPGPNLELDGPFGIIGRPRGFTYSWLPRSEQIATFTARFSAIDQRMYVLDTCGTPGFTNCVEINPGTQLLGRCYDRCYTGGGRCYSSAIVSDDSVAPGEIQVGGTEKVFPEITLYPPLTSPYVENITTGEWVQLDTTMVDGSAPVTINTEDGTAFDTEGNSLTHLLRGSLFLSLYPGNYEFRLLSGSDDETGYMTVCWRDTVVTA